MGRRPTVAQLPASVRVAGKPVIYCEGGHENNYLRQLVTLKIIQDFQEGTKLAATNVELRVKQIMADLENDAIEQIIWIVDGGDEHIKKSKEFIAFYTEWKTKRADDGWKKLSILINHPCFEYWLLLHKCDVPVDATGNAVLFLDAAALYEHVDFKSAFPGFNKNNSANINKLIGEAAADKQGRNLAIKRAKQAASLAAQTSGKNLLKTSRAEMFELFDEDSSACIKTKRLW
jgi:hypothetical protein